MTLGKRYFRASMLLATPGTSCGRLAAGNCSGHDRAATARNQAAAADGILGRTFLCGVLIRRENSHHFPIRLELLRMRAYQAKACCGITVMALEVSCPACQASLRV